MLISRFWPERNPLCSFCLSAGDKKECGTLNPLGSAVTGTITPTPVQKMPLSVTGISTGEGCHVAFLSTSWNVTSHPAAFSRVTGWAEDSVTESHCVLPRGDRGHLWEGELSLCQSISLLSLNIYSPFGVERIKNTNGKSLPRRSFHALQGRLGRWKDPSAICQKLTSLCKELFISVSHCGVM